MAVTPWTQRVAASNNSEFMFSKHGTRICTRQQVRTGDSVSDRAHSIAGRRDHERSSLLSPSLTSGHGTRNIPACPPDYVHADERRPTPKETPHTAKRKTAQSYPFPVSQIGVVGPKAVAAELTKDTDHTIDRRAGRHGANIQLTNGPRVQRRSRDSRPKTTEAARTVRRNRAQTSQQESTNPPEPDSRAAVAAANKHEERRKRARAGRRPGRAKVRREKCDAKSATRKCDLATSKNERARSALATS